MVYEALAGCRGTTRMAKIEERLRRLGPVFVRLPLLYDGNQDWLSNAEAQQLASNPFRAIIASTNPRGHPTVLLAGEVEDSDPLWEVSREECIERSPQALAKCASKLLRISREILILDPYFDPQIARWRATLQEILAKADLTTRAMKRLELHSSSQRSGTTDHWTGECRSWLPRLIPHGVTLRVVRWTQRPHGEKIHPRYILTEIGGIRYDVGIDEGRQGETTDVSLLDLVLYRQRWDELQEFDEAGRPKNTTFDKVDELTVQGTKTI